MGGGSHNKEEGLGGGSVFRTGSRTMMAEDRGGGAD